MKTLIVSIFLMLGCLTSAFAETKGDALEQLSSGNFDGAENTFSTLQKNFDKGLATEYDLLDAYKVFYQKEDRIRPQLDSWIKAYPKSASAYLARGVFYRKLGEFRRGTNYISQVPEDNLKYMEQMFVLSKNDLETSLRLNPKSYLAILHLLNIAQFEGDSQAAENYLMLGNSVLPSNMIVRIRYLIQLTPRWGGSYKSMESFINKCQSQGLSHDKIDLLNAIKLDDQGFVLEEQGKTVEARLAYENALKLSLSGGNRFRQDYLKYSLRICAKQEQSNKQYCQR